MTTTKTALLFIILATTSVSLYAMKAKSPIIETSMKTLKFECKQTINDNHTPPTIDIIFHDADGMIYYLYLYGKNLEKSSLGKKLGENGNYKSGVPIDKTKFLKIVLTKFKNLNKDKAIIIYTKKNGYQVVKEMVKKD